MEKFNVSVGENILFRFLRDENALMWPGPKLQLCRRSSSHSLLV